MFNKAISIVLISVFILIFSLTCVSAAQDNITTDELSVDENICNEYTVIDKDSNQDDLISKSADEKVVSENPSDEILYNINQVHFGNVSLRLYDSVSTNDNGSVSISSYGDGELARIFSSNEYGDLNLDGQIILSIDNKEYYNKIFYSKDYYSQVRVDISNLNLPDNLKIGFHNVTLSYLENGKSTPYTINNIVEFKYPPTLTSNYGTNSINYTINCLPGSNGNFTVYEYKEGESEATHSMSYKGEFLSSGIISNGKGEITINNLATTKYHELRFYMVIDGQNYSNARYVYPENFKQSKDSKESDIPSDTGKTNSPTTNNQESDIPSDTGKTNSPTTNNQGQNSNINSQSKPLATKITAKKATFKAKMKTKKYTITLKAGKKAVKKVKVTLKIGKKIFKATTNNNGKAVFKIKLNKKGTYNSKITFNGNKSYKSSSKTIKIKIK